MLDRAKQPRFFDVLSAAVVTLWLIASFALIVYLSFFEEQATFLEAIGASIFLLVILGIPAFILGGIISLPMWLICRHFYQLNRTVAAIVGALTGAIIFTVIPLAYTHDFSDLPFRTKEDFAVQLIIISISAIAGWNGYRVAWNGRRRKKAARI